MSKSEEKHQLIQDDADPIAPVSIEHHVDEIWERPGKLEQRYNFFDYRFEPKDAYAVMTARTYTHRIDEVTVSGPFSAREPHARMSAPQFEKAVLAYLGRRFRKVKRLDGSTMT